MQASARKANTIVLSAKVREVVRAERSRRSFVMTTIAGKPEVKRLSYSHSKTPDEKSCNFAESELVSCVLQDEHVDPRSVFPGDGVAPPRAPPRPHAASHGASPREPAGHLPGRPPAPRRDDVGRAVGSQHGRRYVDVAWSARQLQGHGEHNANTRINSMGFRIG